MLIAYQTLWINESINWINESLYYLDYHYIYIYIYIYIYSLMIIINLHPKIEDANSLKRIRWEDGYINEPCFEKMPTEV